jgi:hypothetical protein
MLRETLSHLLAAAVFVIRRNGHPPEEAAELGMTDSAVTSAIHRLRRRHSEILRDEVAQTVACREEIDEEIRYLIKRRLRPMKFSADRL